MIRDAVDYRIPRLPPVYIVPAMSYLLHKTSMMVATLFLF